MLLVEVVVQPSGDYINPRTELTADKKWTQVFFIEYQTILVITSAFPREHYQQCSSLFWSLKYDGDVDDDGGVGFQMCGKYRRRSPRQALGDCRRHYNM